MAEPLNVKSKLFLKGVVHAVDGSYNGGGRMLNFPVKVDKVNET